MKHPLEVKVTWVDAVSDTTATAMWEWTPDGIEKVGLEADLTYGRITMGWLGYVNDEKLVLWHDHDDADDSLGNATIIPIGWITKVQIVRGKILYTKEQK